jgi:hypothetical protein
MLRFTRRLQFIGPIPRLGDISTFLLVLVTVLGLIFGLPRVGAEQTGFVMAQSVLGRFNLFFLFVIICYTSPRARNVLVGSICMLICAWLKTSLMNIFMLGVGLALFVNLRIINKSYQKYFVFLFFLSFFLLFGPQLIELLYSTRDILRSGNRSHASAQELMGYFFGRVNSISSYVYILKTDCCKEDVSFLYMIKQVYGTIFGMPFSGNNPTQVFNSQVLGDASSDYNVFTSLTGGLLIDFRGGWLNFSFSVITILLTIGVVFAFIPTSSSKDKIWLFLIVFYPIFLSGDFWEFRMFFESMFLTVLSLKIISAFPSLINLSNGRLKPRLYPKG